MSIKRKLKIIIACDVLIMMFLLLINFILFSDLGRKFDVLLLVLVFVSHINYYSPTKLNFLFYEKPVKQLGYILMCELIFFVFTESFYKLYVGVLLTIAWFFCSLFLSYIMSLTTKKLRFFSPFVNFTVEKFKHFDIKYIKDPKTIKIHDYDAVLINDRNTYCSEWNNFITHCEVINFPIYNLCCFIESIDGKVNLELKEGFWSRHFSVKASYALVKNVIELFFVICLLPIWLPVFIVVSVVIFLKMGRPIFFIQNRVGRHNTLFKLYKFRSMLQESHNQETQENDCRITKLGRILRKYRLDEIPQFFNILKGEMSLVGPRPERADLTKEYIKSIPVYAARQLVKPGITGWAQVNQGYAVGENEAFEKISYDLYYIKNFSLYMDSIIVFKTIKIILTGFGSR